MRSGLHHTCRWCPVTEYMLSFPGEAKLRKAFGMLNSWTGRGLEMRLREDDIGLASQNAARVLISNGVNAGLLLQEGNRDNHTYRLNADWQRPEWSRPANGYVLRKPRPETPQEAPQPRMETIAREYKGPAYEGGHLKPHIGLLCAVQGTDSDGELLPCVGGAIVDRLNQSFNSFFSAAG